jgi:hypothetical protein
MIRFILLWVVSLATLPMLVFGAAPASDEFRIRLFVGIDTTPPTVPSPVSAVPVAPTQIDVSWGPSVDDVYFVGYRLYRDGVVIATTSMTTFSDVGLTPATTYMYYVDAFDGSDNFSATSTSVATTTLALATSTPPVSPEDVGNPTAIPTLRSLEITARTRSALISFGTYGPVTYIVRFGRTREYELGAVQSDRFARSHETTLSGLEPGTKYYIEIGAVDGRGISRVIATDSFTTLPPALVSLPSNVSNLWGMVENGDDVSLSWQNPTDADFAYVRVVRSHLFYPLSPTDGSVVYEGNGTGLEDTDALSLRDRQYYTVFAYNAEGVVSSGAGVLVTKGATVSDTGVVSPAGATSTGPGLVIPVEVGTSNLLEAADVILRQGLHDQSMAALESLRVNEPVQIIIPKGAVVQHLKAIVVTLSDPSDQRLSTTYLLKLSADGERYEGVVPGSVVVGQSRLTVEVYDFEAQVVRRITKMFSYETSVRPAFAVPTTDRLWLIGGGLGFTLILLITWWWLVARRRRREDKK